MAIRNNKLQRALDRVSRAFSTKDEKAFDDALSNLEEKIEEANDEEPEGEEAIEIHNHIPNMDGLGELPPKDPANDEAPPWFKEHAEATDARFKKMNDSLENLMKDRRGRDNFGEEEELLEEDTDENLDMDRRGANDEPSEREEMAERMRENGANDRRRNNDESNKAILGELEFEAPPGTGDRAMRAKDSRYLADSFQDTVSKAEVISPGIRLPTFDRAAPPVRTARAIFALRRTALDLAYNQAPTRGVIDSCMSGRTMDSKRMGFAAQRVLFDAVAAQVGSRNNQRATDGSSFTRQDTVVPRIQGLADINKANREKYGRK